MAGVEDVIEKLPDDPAVIQRALLEWYADTKREFPWRATDDPYDILVSEVMSQQTQLDRIVEPWEAFLDRWPTVDELAAADRSAIIDFWSTHRLGYNNRARYLHEAARQIVEDFDGAIPETPEAIQELPGVGPYTAAAVTSFAFGYPAAVVDTNVKRVFYRAFDIADNDEAFGTAAEWLLPEDRSGEWNNAIMELGGVVCTQTPRCDAEPCPWREWCQAYATGDFTAPDVPTQPTFEGSRRQTRGRILRALANHGEMEIDELGVRVRVDYAPEGDSGRQWLRGVLDDLTDDDLVEIIETESSTRVKLKS